MQTPNVQHLYFQQTQIIISSIRKCDRSVSSDVASLSCSRGSQQKHFSLWKKSFTSSAPVFLVILSRHRNVEFSCHYSCLCFRRWANKSLLRSILVFEHPFVLEEYLPQRAWYQYNDKQIPCVVTK